VGISDKAVRRFKDRVRSLTHRNNPHSMTQIIRKLNEYVRGWGNYFKIQGYAKIFDELDQWARIRLRSMQLRKWKKPRRFQAMLIKAGFNPEEAKKTWIKMDVWRSARLWVTKCVLNLKWFREHGLTFLDDFTSSAYRSL
jgi:RNA-directed DNA polymerase